MNRIIVALCVLAVSAFGQPEVMPSLICSGVTTSAVAVTATGQNTSAYLKALEVAVTPAGGTCTVSIATTGGLTSRTIYSGSFVGTTLLCEVIQNTTSGVVVASFDYPMLSSEALVVSASSATVSNNNLTVTVKPVIDRYR